MTADSVRRAIAFVVGFSAPFVASFLTSKGFVVSEAGVVGAETLALGYLAQSIANVISARKTAAAVVVATPAQVVADLSAGPKT